MKTLSAGAESFAETTQSYFAEIPPHGWLGRVPEAHRETPAEESVSPVIASINCIRKGKWGAFAREMESARRPTRWN
jgi:hypothetical protein